MFEIQLIIKCEAHFANSAYTTAAYNTDAVCPLSTAGSMGRCNTLREHFSWSMKMQRYCAVSH
jgi:hypothetical protein